MTDYSMTAPRSARQPAILEAALEYARHGLRPVPLAPRAKKPILDEWPDRVTTDPTIIAEQFVDAGNVGIAAGNGIAILDFDPRNGGGKSYAAIQEKIGAWPTSWECSTGGDGAHLYLRVDLAPGMKLRSHIPGYPGVDVQWHSGRQCVAPPSVHPSGRPYVWVNGGPGSGVEIAPASAALMDLLVESAPPPPPPPRSVPTTDPPSRRDRVLRWLERQAPAIQGEGGSSACMRVMGSLRRMGVASADEAIDLLEASGWNHRCVPPWDFEGLQGLRRKYEESDAPIGGDDGPPPWPTDRRGPSVADIMMEARAAGERAADLRASDRTTSATVVSAGPGEWPPLDPFEDAPRPVFPVEAFPAWLGTWCSDVSTELQVPIDLTAVLSLATVSTAAIRTFDIEIKTGWREVTALYLAVPLATGERKTAAASKATAPIMAWEEERAEAMAPRILAAQREHAAAKKREKKLIDRLAENGPDSDDIRRELASLTIPDVPRAPCMLSHDSTPERLGMDLAENGECQAIISTESELVSTLLGGYQDKSRPPPLDLYLKAWSGEAHRVKRVSREPVLLAHPRLTICLATQPRAVAQLTDVTYYADRGLLPRFLYAYPRTKMGSRDVRAPPASMRVDAAYSAGIRRIFAADAGETRYVRFDDRASRAAENLMEVVEPGLQPDAGTSALHGWRAKYAGQVARLAGLLAIADVAGSDQGLEATPTVDGETFARAVRIGEYFERHAEVLFGEAVDPGCLRAAAIARWAARRPGGSFSERDALRAGAGGVRTAEELRPALDELIRRGYIRSRPEPGREGKTGRRPGQVYELRPAEGDES